MDRQIFSLVSDDVYSFVVDDDDAFLLLEGQVAFTQSDRVSQQIPSYKSDELDASKDLPLFLQTNCYKNSSNNGVLGYPSLRVVIQIGNMYYNAITETWEKNKAHINPIPIGTNSLSWGEWLDITNRVDYRMGLDDASGFPIKLPKGTTLDGHLKLTFYVPYVSGAWSIDNIQMVKTKTEYTHYRYPMFALIKDLKCTFANQVYLSIKEGYEDDVEYKNINREIGADKFDNLELRIHTQPQGKKYSYGSVVYEGNDSFLINVKKVFSSSVQRQELNLIEQYYNHYSVPRIKYTFTTDNNVSPYIIWRYDNLKEGSHFVINQQTIDLMRGTNTITLEEV